MRMVLSSMSSTASPGRASMPWRPSLMRELVDQRCIFGCSGPDRLIGRQRLFAFDDAGVEPSSAAMEERAVGDLAHLGGLDAVHVAVIETVGAIQTRPAHPVAVVVGFMTALPRRVTPAVENHRSRRSNSSFRVHHSVRRHVSLVAVRQLAFFTGSERQPPRDRAFTLDELQLRDVLLDAAVVRGGIEPARHFA